MIDNIPELVSDLWTQMSLLLGSSGLNLERLGLCKMTPSTGHCQRPRGQRKHLRPLSGLLLLLELTIRIFGLKGSLEISLGSHLQVMWEKLRSVESA